jgi:preprotein translocase subunit SecA
MLQQAFSNPARKHWQVFRYGQRDPLTEYKLEGFELFKDMLARVRRNVIYNVYVFTPTRLDKIDDDSSAAGQQQNGQSKEKGGSRGKKFKEKRSQERVAAAAE